MPPMMSKMVAFPADWLPVYELFKEVRSRQLPAVISCFDGCPRPKRISGACEDAGLLSWSLDIRNSPKEDLGEDIGIQKFLDALSQCAHDSLLWLAPECYDFARRSMAFRVQGRFINYANHSPKLTTYAHAAAIAYIRIFTMLAMIVGGAFYGSVVGNISVILASNDAA